MPMRITTWNINSVRLRIAQVQQFLEEHQPDVLCLQETKVPDDLYPSEAFNKLGYVHQAIAGQKGYHGVSIMSKIPIKTWERHDWCDKGDARHVVATLEDGVEIHNFYIPAGGDIPDPDKNEKFAHKLQFLDEIADWFRDQAGAPDKKRILVGDLNIAPSEHDVWSHKQLLKIVSHTPIEVEKLALVQDTLNWVDAVRHLAPEPEKLFSWWSYRSPDWTANNRGRRLDHIWVTPALQDALSAVQIHLDVRSWERPSDHAPVTVDLKN